jgi:hypothetical protein
MRLVCNLALGRVAKLTQLACIYPLAIASLALGSWLGARAFPTPYDWQYQVMTELASSRDNPIGHRPFCLGLSIACLLMIPSAGYIRRRLRSHAPYTATFGALAMIVGLVGVCGVGVERLVIVDINDSIPLGHQLLTIFGICGLFWGFICFSIASLVALYRGGRQYPLALAMALLIGHLPIIGASSCLLYLYVVPNDLGWVDPEWRDLGVPVYLSFAFWEWLIAYGFLVHSFLLVSMLPAQPPATERVADSRRVLVPQIANERMAA